MLDQIDALAAQGMAREDIDVTALGDAALQRLPAVEDISRRQQLRFGRRPPGTILIGDATDEEVEPGTAPAWLQAIMEVPTEVSPEAEPQEPFEILDRVSELGPAMQGPVMQDPEHANLVYRMPPELAAIQQMPEGPEKDEALKAYRNQQGDLMVQKWNPETGQMFRTKLDGTVEPIPDFFIWDDPVELLSGQAPAAEDPGVGDPPQLPMLGQDQQITAESENTRRYDVLKGILALPKGQERQEALRQFIIDEDLSPNLLKGKLRVDAEGNPVIDPVTKEQVYDPAPINEAELILQSFQPMPFQKIIEQRERQVGKSREAVQASLTAFTEATTLLEDLAESKGINLDAYTGGDAEIDAAQAALDQVTEAGRVAQKQMEQRDREQKIREEGPPVDVAELPSSQRPIAVGLAPQKGLIDAQERERKRQQDLAARERAKQTGSGPRILGGGLAV